MYLLILLGLTFQATDYPFGHLLIFFVCLAVNEYVIDISDNTKINHIFDNFINHFLKLRGSISNPKWHYQILIKPEPSSEGCLLFITSTDLQKIIPSF
jgi:hypothetical protein